jgi:hypothetical protein
MAQWCKCGEQIFVTPNKKIFVVTKDVLRNEIIKSHLKLFFQSPNQVLIIDFWKVKVELYFHKSFQIIFYFYFFKIFFFWKGMFWKYLKLIFFIHMDFMCFCFNIIKLHPL